MQTLSPGLPVVYLISIQFLCGKEAVIVSHFPRIKPKMLFEIKIGGCNIHYMDILMAKSLLSFILFPSKNITNI